MERQLSPRVTLTTNDDSLVGETGWNKIQTEVMYTCTCVSWGFANDHSNLQPGTGFPGHPLSFCREGDRAARKPAMDRQLSDAGGQCHGEGFRFPQTPRTFLPHQAFLGAALKYSSLEMSATPPYHFCSQICSTFIFIKNHSY